jgi:voltage-gated potassium channel
MNSETSVQEKLDTLNIIILILSIYVLIALFVDTVFKLPTEVSRVLNLVDTGICVIFLIDFIKRFSKAKSKIDYMKWGWIDLLSSIPTLDFIRAGRLLRLVRLLRILRAFRSTKHLLNHIFLNKAKGTLTLVTISASLMIILSSIAILQVEDDANSNIKTAEDALWWSYSTITTVGYGDNYPVTTEGRGIAILLMTVGVGLFGTFTAYISSWFISSTIENKPSNEEIDKTFDFEKGNEELIKVLVESESNPNASALK